MEFVNITLDAKEKGFYEDYIAVKQHEQRKIYIDGAIEPMIAYEVLAKIQLFNEEDKDLLIQDRKPIHIYINSAGGEVGPMWQIVDTIMLSDTPVYTINTAQALSAGFLILIAGHKRFSYPHASAMWHEGSLGISSDAGKFRNYVEFSNAEDAMRNSYLLSRTKITNERLEARRNDDWWMLSDEALELGVIDAIIERIM